MPQHPLAQGQITIIRDSILSCALVSIGLPLRLDAPPVHEVKRDEEGRNYEVWGFTHVENNDESPSGRMGKLVLKDLIQLYYSEGFPKWRIENEGHPFAAALDMYENLAIYQREMAKSKPLIGFREPDGITFRWVVWGSEKHRKCVERGLKQV